MRLLKLIQAKYKYEGKGTVHRIGIWINCLECGSIVSKLLTNSSLNNLPRACPLKQGKQNWF